jgi:transaldolase
VANARLAHAAHSDLVGAACSQRIAWTATVARDPYYSETLYVDELVGESVVSVLGESTLELVHTSSAFRGETLRAGLPDARLTLARLDAVGVDVADVLRTVERTATSRAQAAWRDLVDTIEAQLKQATSTI